jgi:hypothetical protein
MLLNRIYTPEEEKERADKALKLNGYGFVKPPYDPKLDPSLTTKERKTIILRNRISCIAPKSHYDQS